MMTKPDFAIAYNDCTDVELRKFVQARQLLASDLSRHELLKALRAADSKATFRFFDLPPEMRLLVYETLLKLQKKGGGARSYCWPAIVATCKQVREEAQSILYEENEVRVCIALGWSYVEGRLTSRDLPPELSVNGKIVHASVASDSMDEVRWPTFLSKMRNIHLICFFNGNAQFAARMRKGWQLRRVNRIIYHLNSFLQGHSSLRKMRVDVSYHLPATVPNLHDALSPLCLFGPHASLKCYGIPQDITQRLTAETAGFNRSENVNVFEKCSILFDKAAFSLVLMTKFNYKLDQISTVEKLLEKVRKATSSRRSKLMTPKRDERLRTRLRALEVALENLGLVEVEAYVENQEALT